MKTSHFLTGLIVLVTSVQSYASTQDKIYLKCKPDPSENLPGGWDFILDKNKMEAAFTYPLAQTEKIKETETEYVIEHPLVNGKRTFEFRLNKYTLRFFNYNLMAVLSSRDPNVVGQCVIVDKQI